MRHDFVTQFYQNADQLPEIIKTYTSQKDEYIALLDDAHANIPLDTWNKCIDTIIRGYLASKDTADSADETERLHKSIKSLFFIAQRHLADKSWTQADVLSFLISRHNIELLASGVPAIKDLWDYCGEFFKPSLEISEQLKTLSSQYAHACLHFFTRLICYMTPLEHLRIQEEFTSPLTEEQLTTLHCFLTVCYEKMHIDPIKYRNILISYANNSSV